MVENKLTCTGCFPKSIHMPFFIFIWGLIVCLSEQPELPFVYQFMTALRIGRVANHVTSDDRVHGISENKLLNSGNIFLDIFVNTYQN